ARSSRNDCAGSGSLLPSTPRRAYAPPSELLGSALSPDLHAEEVEDGIPERARDDEHREDVCDTAGRCDPRREEQHPREDDEQSHVDETWHVKGPFDPRVVRA